MESSESGSIKVQKGLDIQEVNLLPSLVQTEDMISRTCEFFFKGGLVMKNAPFKGFLLEGPPGIGKTEVVKQVARKLDRRIGNVFLLFVDGATIAAPRWGDAEKTLDKVFEYVKILNTTHTNAKLIILFDDVESLMLARGVDIAKEWHYSINSIMFHKIDALDPTRAVVCATTNRSELVDEALSSRLYPVQFPQLKIDDLASVVRELLDSTVGHKDGRDGVEKTVIERLAKLKNPTLRDARHMTVVECVQRRLWSV